MEMRERWTQLRWRVSGRELSKAEIFDLDDRDALAQIGRELHIDVGGFVSDNVAKCLYVAKLSGEDFTKLLYEYNEFDTERRRRAMEVLQRTSAAMQKMPRLLPATTEARLVAHPPGRIAKDEGSADAPGHERCAGGRDDDDDGGGGGGGGDVEATGGAASLAAASTSAAAKKAVIESMSSEVDGRQKTEAPPVVCERFGWMQTFPKPRRSFARRMRWKEDEICHCCGGPDSTEDDPIGYCDGCNVPVHRSCYDADFSPEQFFCDACSVWEEKPPRHRARRLLPTTASTMTTTTTTTATLRPDVEAASARRCALCPTKGGALMTVDGEETRSIHVACALWHPLLEVNYETRRILGCEKFRPATLHLTCILCGAGGGGVVQCNAFELPQGKDARLAAATPPVKRKRGRPRKYPLVVENGHGSAVPTTTLPAGGGPAATSLPPAGAAMTATPKEKCRKAFHVLCARGAGWYLLRDALEGKHYACCAVHSSPAVLAAFTESMQAPLPAEDAPPHPVLATTTTTTTTAASRDVHQAAARRQVRFEKQAHTAAAASPTTMTSKRRRRSGAAETPLPTAASETEPREERTTAVPSATTMTTTTTARQLPLSLNDPVLRSVCFLSEHWSAFATLLQDERHAHGLLQKLHAVDDELLSNHLQELAASRVLPTTRAAPELSAIDAIQRRRTSWLLRRRALGVNSLVADAFGSSRREVLHFLASHTGAMRKAVRDAAPPQSASPSPTPAVPAAGARHLSLVVVGSEHDMDVWMRAFRRWAPPLQIFAYYMDSGTAGKKPASWTPPWLATLLPRVDCVLTTYACVVAHRASTFAPNRTDWMNVVLDEAHRIHPDSESLRSAILAQSVPPGGRVMCVSLPLSIARWQDSRRRLWQRWSLAHLLFPDWLQRKFCYADVCSDRHATIDEEDDDRNGLQRAMREVLEASSPPSSSADADEDGTSMTVPEWRDHYLSVPMTRLQRRRYRRLLKTNALLVRRVFAAAIAESHDVEEADNGKDLRRRRKKKSGGVEHPLYAELAGLCTQLRRCAVSAELVEHTGDDTERADGDDDDDDDDDDNDDDDDDDDDDSDAEDDDAPSGKLLVLLKLLQGLERRGKSALVISRHEDCLDVIEKLCRVHDLSYVRGGFPGASVRLLSSAVACLGVVDDDPAYRVLDGEKDVVIVVDPHLDEDEDLHAMQRQLPGTVSSRNEAIDVIRLVSADSCEERIAHVVVHETTNFLDDAGNGFVSLKVPLDTLTSVVISGAARLFPRQLTGPQQTSVRSRPRSEPFAAFARRTAMTTDGADEDLDVLLSTGIARSSLQRKTLQKNLEVEVQQDRQIFRALQARRQRTFRRRGTY